MKMSELCLWLDCDDVIKMSSLIDQIDDETVLRKFALLNAKSVDAFLGDPRSLNAIAVAEAYLKGDVGEKELEGAYNDACSAVDELETAHMSNDDDLLPSEGNEWNAALVALWAVFPTLFAGDSSLENARASALHTAYYCFDLFGFEVLQEQIRRFEAAGVLD